MSIRFRLNGRDVEASSVDPHEPLLHFLRARGLTGTKEGCAEGECGACAVAVVRKGPDGKTRYVPINSCLVLTPAVHGLELVSVEGVATEEALHPVQLAMVEHGGSQCGFCTPGFVVSLFAEYYRETREAGDYDPESIGGNLCRCTGYRPIRDALVSLRKPSDEDPHRQRLNAEAPAPAGLSYEAEGVRFERPTSLPALFDVLEAHPKAKLVAGGTDVVVEVNHRDARFDAIVSLDALPELRGIEVSDDAITIGAGEPLAAVEEALHGQVPLLDELWPLFSSRLIRNRATLGGNLGNASPIGDSPPALLALDAEVVLASKTGERTVPLDGFFTGYRKTILAPGEILRAVRIPKPLPTIQRFYKVSKRVMDDISTVAGAFALTLAADGTIAKARLAYGGVAATPVRAKDAEAALVGKRFDESAVRVIRPLLQKAFSPMDDHRGSAAYRKAMVTSLVEKLAFEVSAPTHSSTEVAR
ncbi:MAG: xanthine dehydrogenase small subunit [Polyangiales bacterium]